MARAAERHRGRRGGARGARAARLRAAPGALGAWLQPGTCRCCAARRLRRARGLGRPSAWRTATTWSATRTEASSRCSPPQRPATASRRSTVIEPPCTRVALDDPGVAAFARGGAELYAKGAHLEPEAFLRMFLGAVGSDFDPPSPLPPALEQGVRALARERGPWEADIPLERLAALGLPTLVVSGAHHPAFDAICDVLEQRPLGASVSCCRASATTRSSIRASTRRSSPSSRVRSANRRPALGPETAPGLGDSMLRRGHDRRGPDLRWRDRRWRVRAADRRSAQVTHCYLPEVASAAPSSLGRQARSASIAARASARRAARRNASSTAFAGERVRSQPSRSGSTEPGSARTARSR